MKKTATILAIAFFIASCGTGAGSEQKSSSDETKTPESSNPSYDPKRGEGKFTKVEVSPTLNTAIAAAGKKVYEVKCSSCHKTTDEKLVGPGWKGVTSRHSAEWIMNFATNPDAMLDKDPQAKAMLEICLVRMPNQNLSDDDTKAIYEFMREIDGVK